METYIKIFFSNIDECFKRLSTKPLEKWMLVGCFFVVVYPILINMSPLWDGSVIDYASISGMPDIFETWFYEAGGPLLVPIHKIVFYLSKFILIKQKILVNVISVIFIALSLSEIIKLFKLLDNKKDTLGELAALFLLVSPLSSIYFSDIFMCQTIFMYFCFLGTRFYLNERPIVGLTLVFISFQQSANPVTFFSLIALAYLFGSRREWKKDLVALSLACFYFLFVFRWLASARGVYADGNYNRMVFSNLLEYEKFYQPFVLAIKYHLIPFLILIPFLKWKNWKSFSLLPAMLLIAGLNIVPYVFVGKSIMIQRYLVGYHEGYTIRYLMNLFPILYLGLFLWISKTIQDRFRTKVFLILFILPSLFYNAKLTAKFYGTRSKIITFHEEFQHAVESLDLKPGEIKVNYGSMGMAFYEVQYLFYRAKGKAAWSVLPKDDIKNLLENQKYRRKYVLTDFSPLCVTQLSIKQDISLISRKTLLFYLYAKPWYHIPGNHFELSKVSQDCISEVAEVW
ncbi:MAG: hypothetical protein R3A11_05240 [Bdellovibrionota bacterium]